MDNIANPFTAHCITSAPIASGIVTTLEKVITYIEHVKNAMIMDSVQCYDIKCKKLLTANEKYYCVDLGLHNIVKTSNDIDLNKLYENIIYLELLSRGYKIRGGKTDNYEIDFIAYKSMDRVYIQVCYLLATK
jgi:predicted AAA+ superfamily ATPase